ncbi:MAG: PadR family transcriptional regulator [Chloroflexi bacterium]|nr:PadR family transcriptional regulator [Ktedonobacteraceae bacterium]MBV9708819.1 PadR family transcriptional regulator [Chloroflexota bacterium]
MQISEPAEYIILGLLKNRPMHGYEMFQHFEGGTLRQILHLEMSQMYAFLKKLERLHYIEAQLEPQGTRPPRKVYHLTKQGHDLFLHWLTQPVEKPRDVRILFLIKLYFVRLYLPEQIPNLLSQEILACQQFLKRLESKYYTNSESGKIDSFERVILSSRIHHTRSLLEWIYTLQVEMVEDYASDNIKRKHGL